MTGLPKNLIAFLGAIVAAAIVAIGVLMFALPLFTQALATREQTAAVRSQNDLQQTIIDSLAAQRENIDELQADVDSARALVPAAPDFASFSSDIEAAVVAVGGTLQSFSPGATSAFAGGAQQPAASDPAASEPANDANASTEASAPAAGVTEVQAQPGGALRSLVAIVAKVPSPQAAAAFVDAIRTGTRAVEIVDVAVTADGDGTTVTINAAIYSKAAAS